MRRWRMKMVEPDQSLYCGVVAPLQFYHSWGSAFCASLKIIHFVGKYLFQNFWIWNFFWKFFLAFFARSIPAISIFARSIPAILDKQMKWKPIIRNTWNNSKNRDNKKKKKEKRMTQEKREEQKKVEVKEMLSEFGRKEC